MATETPPPTAEIPGTSTVDIGGTTAYLPKYVDYSGLLGIPAVASPRVPFINYSPIDPRLSAQFTGDYNRTAYGQNLDDSRQYTRALIESDLQAIQQFSPRAIALARQTLQEDNAYNQNQLVNNYESVVPGARALINENLDRARQLSTGRFSDNVQQRGFEASSRNLAADSNAFRGFGTDSPYSQKVSDLLSANERLKLQETGSNLAQKWLMTASQTVVDKPINANFSSRLPVTPSVSGSQLATGQLAELNQLTTISPTAALQSDIQQRQFDVSNRIAQNQTQTDYFMKSQMFNSELAFKAYETALNAQLQQFLMGANIGNSVTQQNTATGILRNQQQRVQDSQTYNNIAGLVGLGIRGYMAYQGGGFGGGGNSTSPLATTIAGSDGYGLGQYPTTDYGSTSPNSGGYNL